jgi:hypothetical protein
LLDALEYINQGEEEEEAVLNFSCDLFGITLLVDITNGII